MIYSAHCFSFDGGDLLCSMGASWFVSYCYYDKIDRSHTNWKRVSTYRNRIATYNRTVEYHAYWLRRIADMSIDNLNKNSIGLNGYKVKEMAKELLEVI